MTKLEALQQLAEKVEAGERFILGSSETAGFTKSQASTAEQITLRGDMNAALSLHNAVFPGWEVEVRSGKKHWACVNRVDHAPLTLDDLFSASSSDPARALLLADLRALIAIEQQNRDSG